MKHTRILTYFVISGDALDPITCTRIMGVSPTECYAKGQQRKGKRPPTPTGEWVIEPKWMDSYKLDEGIDCLMKTVWPLRDAVARVTSQTGVKASVVSVVELLDERPEYCLSKKNIARLAKLGVDYSMDLYDFRGVD